MNILIVGAGAMGSLLGARHSKSSASVWLFSTDRKHMEAIRRDGLVIEELDGAARNYQLAAYYDLQQE